VSKIKKIVRSSLIKISENGLRANDSCFANALNVDAARILIVRAIPPIAAELAG